MRYIPIQVYKKDKNSKPIPFWELNCMQLGEEIKLLDYYEELTTATLQDALWDVVERKVTFGDVVIVKKRKGGFVEGDNVLVEISHRLLAEETIDEIQFNGYESHITKVDDLSAQQRAIYFKKRKPKTELLEIRFYNTVYVMKSGRVVKYQHQMFRLQQ